MCAENGALRRCSVSTLVRMSSHINCTTNIKNANRAALEKPGRLHLVIRMNGRANRRAPPWTYAAAEHTRAPAQRMWALGFGSRATRPCTFAWSTQMFSASCGVTQKRSCSTLHSKHAAELWLLRTTPASARVVPHTLADVLALRVWVSEPFHRSMDNAIHNHRLHALRLLRVRSVTPIFISRQPSLLAP